MPNAAAQIDRNPIFTQRLSIGSGSVKVAIKDLIDLAGTITTASCRAVESSASVADADAPCLKHIREAAEADKIEIVGKTNLHELAFGATGINLAYGTPTNPVDPTRMPGGSSSGSAVALALGEADVALGTDTGGSIRVPASFCGVAGLKTTWGRVSTEGAWALAPFLDTIGPMGRTVDQVIAGMELLEPGFAAKTASAGGKKFRLGMVLPRSVDVDPEIISAVTFAINELGVESESIELEIWDETARACLTVLLGEAWRQDQHLLSLEGLVTEPTAERLWLGSEISDAQLASARSFRAVCNQHLEQFRGTIDAFILPSTPTRAPLLTDQSAPVTALTRFANLGGLPALSVPLPIGGPSKQFLAHSQDSHLPIGLQVMGYSGEDDVVCAIGRELERCMAKD